MSMLKTSWRCSFAATALWALLGNNPSQAVADGQTAEKSPPPATERDQLWRHWLSLKQKVEQLEKEGKHDEAERLKREMQEMQAKLYPHGAQAGAAAARRPQTSGETEAKLQHLRAAAENLRAAGLGEQADNVTKMMQRLQSEAREGGRPRPESPPREIMELRSEFQQMRREIQELREQLKHLIEQQGNRK